MPRSPRTIPTARRNVEAFRVTLRPEGDGPPAANRLKLALKTLIRRHGLRAVLVEDVGGPLGGRGTNGEAAGDTGAAAGPAGDGEPGKGVARAREGNR